MIGSVPATSQTSKNSRWLPYPHPKTHGLPAWDAVPGMVLLVRDDGTVLETNSTFREFFGLGTDAAAAELWERALPDASRLALHRSLEQRRDFRMQFAAVRDGPRRGVAGVRRTLAGRARALRLPAARRERRDRGPGRSTGAVRPLPDARRQRAGADRLLPGERPEMPVREQGVCAGLRPRRGVDRRPDLCRGDRRGGREAHRPSGAAGHEGSTPGRLRAHARHARRRHARHRGAPAAAPGREQRASAPSC